MKISWGRSPRARASSTCRLKSAVYCTMLADTELTFGFFRSSSCCALVSVYRFCIDDLIIQRNRTGCFFLSGFRGTDHLAGFFVHLCFFLSAAISKATCAASSPPFGALQRNGRELPGTIPR